MGGFVVDRMHTCCFTGHRRVPDEDLPLVSQSLRREILRLIREEGIERFLSGGALGFDTLAAEVVLEVAADYPNVSLVIVQPCADQARSWNVDDVRRYGEMLRRASEVVTLAPAYRPGCMQARNRYLVEHSAVCLCYLTERSGGTAYTVRYAASRGLPIVNVAPPGPDLLSGL